MIDYEKLKIAHELAREYYLKTSKQISIEIECLENHVEYLLHLHDETNDACSSIDCLIAELTKLIKLTQSDNSKPLYDNDRTKVHAEGTGTNINDIVLDMDCL